MDGILIAKNDFELVQTIKRWLSSIFAMKDMGETSYILGEIILTNQWPFNKNTILRKFLNDLICKGCNLIDTSFSRGENLSKEMSPKTPKENRKITNVPYSIAFGNLMYATMCTRPNI